MYKIATILAPVLLGASLLSVTSQADERPLNRPSSALDRYVTQISERLNLSDDQRERIRPVLAANAAAMMSALQHRNEKKVGEEQKKNGEGQVVRKERRLDGDMQGIRSETHESLADILTPQQMADYEAMRQEDRARTRELVKSRRY